MKLRNLKPVEHLRWVTLLVSVIAGLGCAGTVSGQVVVGGAAAASDIDDSESDIISVTLGADDVINQQLEAFDDQLVITRKPCHGTAPVHVSARDEVWLVSARNSHCAPCELSKLRCCLLKKGSWQESSLDELVARHSFDKTRSTMIYVHGNRTDLGYAKARGLQVYQAAFQDSPCPRPPIRFVVFAWKSEKEIRRPVTDFSVKSNRAVNVGNTLSQLLGQFEDRNMAIIGFSLGTQVILSGLSCAQQQEEANGLGKYRVALIAPALDPGFVRSKLFSFSNNPLVEQTSVFYNRKDRAIKAAQIIVRCRSREYIAVLRQLADSSRMSLNPIRILDITRELTKRHSVTRYAASPTVRAGLAQMLFAVQGSAVLPFESEPPSTPPALESVVVPTN